MAVHHGAEWLPRRPHCAYTLLCGGGFGACAYAREQVFGQLVYIYLFAGDPLLVCIHLIPQAYGKKPPAAGGTWTWWNDGKPGAAPRAIEANYLQLITKECLAALVFRTRQLAVSMGRRSHVLNMVHVPGISATEAKRELTEIVTHGFKTRIGGTWTLHKIDLSEDARNRALEALWDGFPLAVLAKSPTDGLRVGRGGASDRSLRE